MVIHGEISVSSDVHVAEDLQSVEVCKYPRNEMWHMISNNVAV